MAAIINKVKVGDHTFDVVIDYNGSIIQISNVELFSDLVGDRGYGDISINVDHLDREITHLKQSGLI